MHQKGLSYYFVQLKKLQLLGTSSPRPPTIFYVSAKLNNFQKSNIQYRFVHECGQSNMFSNHACCCLIQMFASNMHQNEWFFKFDFSKIFWGGAHQAPSPDPSSRFHSGLRPWARASPSILGALLRGSIVTLGPTTISELPPPMLERILCISRNFFSPSWKPIAPLCAIS